MSTKTENLVPCMIGCGNPEMRHYGVRYICQRAGYTALHCERHKCVTGGDCCKPVTSERIKMDFRASCNTCGGHAEYYFRKEFEGGSSMDVFYCFTHRHAGCILIYEYIEKVAKELEAEQSMTKKKPPVEEEEETESESRNKRGDGCPFRVKKRGRPKKGKKSAGTTMCGKYATYYCSKQSQFLCYDHNHLNTKQRECCSYITDSQPYDHSQAGWSEFGPPSADAEMGSWSDMDTKTEVENPCSKCKDEGTYWCKKAGDWRCGVHMHTRWDCCDYVTDSDGKKKGMKEVIFENANA